jgi:aminocarboxymuconate-semialdehyde decarboxylase
MYGTDYPCWELATALELLAQIDLSKEDQQKIFYDNARRILNLRDPVQPGVEQSAREPALA